MGTCGSMGDWRAAWKLCIRALIDDSLARSVGRSSFSVSGAILPK